MTQRQWHSYRLGSFQPTRMLAGPTSPPPLRSRVIKWMRPQARQRAGAQIKDVGRTPRPHRPASPRPATLPRAARPVPNRTHHQTPSKEVRCSSSTRTGERLRLEARQREAEQLVPLVQDTARMSEASQMHLSATNNRQQIAIMRR